MNVISHRSVQEQHSSGISGRKARRLGVVRRILIAALREIRHRSAFGMNDGRLGPKRTVDVVLALHHSPLRLALRMLVRKPDAHVSMRLRGAAVYHDGREAAQAAVYHDGREAAQAAVYHDGREETQTAGV